MKNKVKKSLKAACVILLGTGVALTSGCGQTASEPDRAEETVTAGVTEASSDGDGEAVFAVITLSDNGSTVSAAEGGSAAGVKLNGNKVEISAGGTYEISGTLSDGQIYVEVSDSETVTLLLDGVSLTSETEAAVCVEEAKKVRVILADGTENLIQSGTSMPETADENASGGALFSRDDLSISGSGSLTVNGYINDGIHGNDDLDIESGSIKVNAVHHAVKANETLTVEGGSLELSSGTDGIHSENDLLITGGDIDISCGDDGIHADAELTIEDGTIVISESYEGIEGNRIYVKGGDISVTSRDDGFNAYGGRNNLGMGMNPFGKSGETSDTDDPELVIDGGSICVNAGGDGLDSNGDLIVNGGYIIVDGPESSANGAIDSGTENGGVCQINGGTVLAIGASGMAERFGDSSEQNSFRLTVSQASAGTQILIIDENGNELFSHTSAKSFSSIVFSSPDLLAGCEYTVTVGSQSYSFTQTDGAYTDSSGGMGGGMNNAPGGGAGGRTLQPGGTPGGGGPGEGM